MTQADEDKQWLLHGYYQPDASLSTKQTALINFVALVFPWNQENKDNILVTWTTPIKWPTLKRPGGWWREERTEDNKRKEVTGWNTSFQNAYYFFFILVALRCGMSGVFQSTENCSIFHACCPWETINNQSFLTHVSLDEVLSCFLTEFRVHIRTSISNVVL